MDDYCTLRAEVTSIFFSLQLQLVCLLGSSHRENVDSARKVDDYRNFPKLFAETRLECV